MSWLLTSSLCSVLNIDDEGLNAIVGALINSLKSRPMTLKLAGNKH